MSFKFHVSVCILLGIEDDEDMNVNKYSCEMLKEGRTNLKAHCSSRMPMQGPQHHYSTFSADSLALTLHVSIQKPSSSSSSSLSLPSSSIAEHTMVTRYFETIKPPPTFIDFLGVGH